MTHENQAVCGKAVADAWVYVFVSQQPALGTLRRDTTKSDMESRCQNILAYTSALEICVMVLVLSREAPLRVKVYFQCAYFYSLYLDRETKWNQMSFSLPYGNVSHHCGGVISNSIHAFACFSINKACRLITVQNIPEFVGHCSGFRIWSFRSWELAGVLIYVSWCGSKGLQHVRVSKLLRGKSWLVAWARTQKGTTTTRCRASKVIYFHYRK